MKWKKILFWYLITSTILTLLNGLILPVIPIPASNFLIANLMYWFYYQQKHSILIMILFTTAIGIMLSTAILLKKQMWKRRWFWAFLAINSILYVLDLLRNCYFVFWAVTTMPDSGKIISETIYFISMVGDLVLIAFCLIFISDFRKNKAM